MRKTFLGLAILNCIAAGLFPVLFGFARGWAKLRAMDTFTELKESGVIDLEKLNTLTNWTSLPGGNLEKSAHYFVGGTKLISLGAMLVSLTFLTNAGILLMLARKLKPQPQTLES